MTLRLIIRDIPQPSRMVALVNPAGKTVTSFVVHDGGEFLEIYLFNGSPRQPWRKWAKQHYPAAKFVRFARMEGDTLRPRPPLSLADPRAALLDPEVYEIAAIASVVLASAGIAIWGLFRLFSYLAANPIFVTFPRISL